MKALISVAICGMIATAMVSSYPIHAATRSEICMKSLRDNGVALNNIFINGGYCYDGSRCPKMNELLGTDSKGYAIIGFTPSFPPYSAEAIAAETAACNACTSGGKPLCVSH